MSSCCQSKSTTAPPSLKDKVKTYRPVIVTGFLSLAIAVALSLSETVPFMDGFMGTALILLAFLKLLSLDKFGEIFRQYDPAAKRLSVYADAYPFIEAGLGILFLSGYFPLFANFALMVIFAINTIGVFRVIKSGSKVQCGCVGASFALPVGKVTLAENLLMICMATINLWML